MSEEREHAAVCKYIKLAYPKAIFLTDASGVKLPTGLAVKFSRLKSGRGIPDLIILEPRGGFHGLCIELKRTGTKVFLKDGETVRADKHLHEQAEVLNTLIEKGYFAVFAIGTDAAIKIIDNYMKG